MRTFPTGKRPVICVTTGDPRGIGPEITKKALKDSHLAGKADFIVLQDPGLDRNNIRLCAKKSLEFIDTAFHLIMDKKADALVTGPVSKEAINQAGIKFAGHTEYLAKLSGAKRIAMMFTSSRLKVSIATRHIALKDVPKTLSINTICDTVGLTHDALTKWFGVPRPRIGVSGLNPHCGEGGIFGEEEKTIIAPAVKKLAKSMEGITGPIPADTLMHDAYSGKVDAAVCMYHDQGLAAFKMVARSEGVNLTLGLPFIRTSVDHGTGFDIAGKGIADPGSMAAAISTAIDLCLRARC